MRFFNWTNVLTALLICLLTWFFSQTYSTYWEYRGIVTTVIAHVSADPQRMEQMQRQQEILAQIAKDVDEVKRATLTVTGVAKVQNDGGDESCILINTEGNAFMYAQAPRARITNMSSQEQQSVVVKVNGTFQHPDSNYIVLLSKKAGAMLDLQPGRMAKIRIEPAEEKKKQ